jgi:outer membrane biogenesis lipoprotein LolB
VPEPRAPLPDLAGIPKSFEMSARLSIRQGDRSDIARLRWTRSPGGDQWILSSPIGTEVARIESSASGAILEQAGAGREEAPSFEALTARLLGVGLDPDELTAWLHGRPPPRGAGEWQVSIDETQRAGAVDIARRMTATRGETAVKLVVDNYRALGE